MGQVAGYTVADYLIQHASRERHYERVPASTWDAVISHIRDPADTARLADSAEPAAVPLRHPAVPSGRRRRRRERRPAAGRAAARARRPGRGGADPARQGQRQRHGYFGPPVRLGWPCREQRPRRPAGLRDRAAPATGTPSGSWPSSWPSAATWTGGVARPGRRRRPACRPAAGRAAGQARRPGRDCAPGPTPATGSLPGGWPSCWPSSVTWTGCAPGPTPAAGRRLVPGRAAGRAR